MARDLHVGTYSTAADANDAIKQSMYANHHPRRAFYIKKTAAGYAVYRRYNPSQGY